MDYFLSVFNAEEISTRSFEITGFVIEVMCSNYNAWYLR